MWNWRPSLNCPRTEVPEFTRCCCCLPLRHGLLVWGYFKMAGLLFITYLLCSEVSQFLQQDYVHRNGVPAPLAIILTMVIIDIVFNIEFIIAGHLKHEQLFQVYYYYSLVFLGLYTLGFVSIIIWNISNYNFTSFGFVLYMTIEFCSTTIPMLGIQCYVTLLVRSEVRKLNNGSNFRFVNNAAEASCSLDLPLPATNHAVKMQGSP